MNYSKYSNNIFIFNYHIIEVKQKIPDQDKWEREREIGVKHETNVLLQRHRILTMHYTSVLTAIMFMSCSNNLYF